MEFNIGSRTSKYRGVENVLLDLDFKKNKKRKEQNVVFWGIDIVFDMAESLLENVENEYIRGFLNENGLCPDTKNIDKIIEVSDIGKYEVFPVYVYSVRI